MAARRLTTRAGRGEAGRFLAEGAQAVGEALRYGTVHELFVTETAAARYPDLIGEAERAGVSVCPITTRAAELLSETVTPQGIVGVCAEVVVPLETALASRPALVAVLVEVADPGNAGTVVRVADAAGAGAVVFAGDAVDVHNGKCVRASTGSVFHLPIARAGDPAAVLAACRAAGLRLVAADGGAGRDLTAGVRSVEPTAWLFGSEAHGLPDAVLDGVDDVVRVPVHGRAESLNLATAAAVCLYSGVLRPPCGG